MLVLGLDVLGNPYGLITGVGAGAKNFFYEPYQVLFLFVDKKPSNTNQKKPHLFSLDISISSINLEQDYMLYQDS